MKSEVSTAGLAKVIPQRIMREMPDIHDHQVIRQIGSGAYGEVWLARSLTGAWRAVKIVWREDFSDEATFIREFEGIKHYEPIARNYPGLVHILHVGTGEMPSAHYYYVMELADDAHSGIQFDPAEYTPRTIQSDKAHYNGQPLPIDYCIEVAAQLAHALLYLHNSGLTHRDVKPANVIFVNGRAKLADIGLVATPNQMSFVGTEGFIPPEGPGTPRADVFALAKVLYEISTGKDRLSFPELPDEVPTGSERKKWQAFNTTICQAAEPREQHAQITTADQFARAMDKLRGLPSPWKYRKAKRPLKSGTKLLFASLGGALFAGFFFAILLAGLWWQYPHIFTFLNSSLSLGIPLPHSAVPTALPTATLPQPLINTGLIMLTSMPQGASIYDKDGNYVEETPYGPAPYPAGEKVTFTLKKTDYVDFTCFGIVPNQSTLVLGGDLMPYNPPILGQPWQDTAGLTYSPQESYHESATPVLTCHFRSFTDTLQSESAPPHATPDAPPNDLTPPDQRPILTTPEGITAYIHWLKKACATAGVLGDDFTIHAVEAPLPPATTPATSNLHAYKLKLARMYQVPITIISSPPGASIFFNGKLIGSTPLEQFEVTQAPYIIEARLPGHTPLRRSGLDPTDVLYNLTLERNQAITFDSPWTNSQGSRLIPISPILAGMNTEVTVKQYRTFCESTRHTPPPPTSFSQQGDHPVVNVSYPDAVAYANWLTMHEQAAGLIDTTDSYEVPTDQEWSQLAAMPTEQGSTPYQRSIAAALAAHTAPFFWGNAWPPKARTGNFADKSALSHLPSSRYIVDYADSFPHTAPVGSFPPNSLQLHDIDGNVQEWTSSEFQASLTPHLQDHQTVRGGSFLSFRPSQLSPALRTPTPPTHKDPALGFRLVLRRTITVK